MKYLKLLLVVVVVGILLFFFLKNVNFHEVIDSIKAVNPLYPLVFLLGLYIQLFIRGYRWGLILKSHKSKIPLLTLYNYTVIGFFLNVILPGKIGEPAKGILLAGEEKISRSTGLASVVLERLIDFLMIVLLFLTSLFFIKSNQSPLLVSLKKISFFVFPIILFFFFLFYLVNTGRVFIYVEKVIRGLARILPQRFRERAIGFGINFVKGLRLNLSVVDYVKLLLASIMVWLFLVPFYWFLMQGFTFGGNVGVLESIPYFSVIVASASVPTPGMAGSFDIVSREVLRSSAYNASVNEAVAYTVLAHFLILVVMVIPGLTASWVKGINMKTIRNIKHRNETGDQPADSGASAPE